MDVIYVEKYVRPVDLFAWMRAFKSIPYKNHTSDIKDWNPVIVSLSTRFPLKYNSRTFVDISLYSYSLWRNVMNCWYILMSSASISLWHFSHDLYLPLNGISVLHSVMAAAAQILHRMALINLDSVALQWIHQTFPVNYLMWVSSNVYTIGRSNIGRFIVARSISFVSDCFFFKHF